MPLIITDVIRGHDQARMTALLDVIHDAVVENGDAEYSFGQDVAQFLLGDLPTDGENVEQAGSGS